MQSVVLQYVCAFVQLVIVHLYLRDEPTAQDGGVMYIFRFSEKVMDADQSLVWLNGS